MRRELRIHRRARELPTGATVTVLKAGTTEPAAVYRHRRGPLRYRQPLTVGENGLDGWTDEPIELVAEWGDIQLAASSHMLRTAGRYLRRAPAASGVPASQFLRELRAAPAGPRRALSTPDAFELTVGSTVVTVESPLGGISVPSDDPARGPVVFVELAEIGIDADGNGYWDPVAVDAGDETSLQLNPFTLELTASRKADG